jgi:hypothetical protein
MNEHTRGPWHLVEEGSIIRVHFSLPDGRQSGVAVTIGSTAFQFRAPRQGSHRGETMVYRPFAEHDRANARLIAAAPDLLQLVREAFEHFTDQQPAAVIDLRDWVRAAAAALAKADGPPDPDPPVALSRRPETT